MRRHAASRSFLFVQKGEKNAAVLVHADDCNQPLFNNFSDHSLVPASYYGRLNLDKVFCNFFGSLQLQRQRENIEGKERL
jgi:hypothetical protein